MGVEYAHYFIVRDPGWVAGPGVIPAVDALLRQWDIVGGAPEVFNLEGGRRRKIRTSLGKAPRNAALCYPGVEGREGIVRIMGPSYYPEDQIGPRYFQRIDLVVGSDLRVHPSNEYFYVSVDSTAAVKARWSGSGPYESTIVMGSAARLPKTSVQAGQRLPVPDGFVGLWRGALRLDCGKDLPAFVDRANAAPGTEFRTALEAAFAAEVIEIGFVD